MNEWTRIADFILSPNQDFFKDFLKCLERYKVYDNERKLNLEIQKNKANQAIKNSRRQSKNFRHMTLKTSNHLTPNDTKNNPTVSFKFPRNSTSSNSISSSNSKNNSPSQKRPAPDLNVMILGQEENIQPELDFDMDKMMMSQMRSKGRSVYTKLGSNDSLMFNTVLPK